MSRGVTARQWLSAAADLLFPPRCAGCGRVGSHWCADCAAATSSLREPLCLRCGYPLVARDEACPACPSAGFAFAAARSWAAYAGQLRQAILRLKHRPNRALGRALSAPLIQLAQTEGWAIDLVVAIPLSAGRQVERGYNAVDLLAGPLAAALGLPLGQGSLSRQRETSPQMALTVRQRWENVRAAFVAEPAAVRGRRLLLLDDIMTTGATLDAAASALRSAGAAQVYALTLARTLQAEDAGVLVH